MNLSRHRQTVRLALSVGLLIVIVLVSLFLYDWSLSYRPSANSNGPIFGPAYIRGSATTPAGSKPAFAPSATTTKPILSGYAVVTAASAPVFEYAHGTVTADDEFFIGMRDHDGNPFPTNQVFIFTDPADLSKYRLAFLPEKGSVESAIYDSLNDKVYVELADNHALDIYAIDPHTYAVSTVIATTSLDAGAKPAIVTDGVYVYGITDTEPSAIFKVRISDGALTVNADSHILDGHSAAIGIYASSTELYFGGGISHAFEKVDAVSLRTMAETIIPSCDMTDDMPFGPIGPVQSESAAVGGYVYIGCETNPYGERVRTSDMSVVQFSLPGESYGLFIYGPDLYNAARDGNIDIFPDSDISRLERFYAVGGPVPLRPDGNEMQLNELFYSTTTDSLYFTAWLGLPGLFRVSTTTSSTSDSV